MDIPGTLADIVARETGLKPRSATMVSGGSINRAARLETADGPLFLKWNRQAPDDMFRLEEEGLELLRSAESGLRIPAVLSRGEPDGELPGYLLMEYIEPHRGSEEAFEELGRALAQLHRKKSDHFGLKSDNYIGRLPQSNRPHKKWRDFFIRERIEPQLKMAVDSSILPESLTENWGRLAGSLDSLFPPTEPSLIHGDLWSGNFLFSDRLEPVLIDPAVYFGHPEMELAFTRMFGGFSSVFYRAYEEINPLSPGFGERVPIYNLYPLLVHVNLFGGGYAREAASLLERY